MILLSQSLRNAVLQSAITGKLNTTVETEEAQSLLDEMFAKRDALIASNKISKIKVNNKNIKEIELEIPENWCRVRLGDISEIITDGVHQTPKYQSSGVRFVSATNIRTGVLSFENCKYITEELFEEIDRRCHIRKNTILISKSGTLGTVAIVGDDTKFGIFETIAVVNLIDGLNINYVKLALEYLFMVATEDLSKGIGVKHLHLNVISEIQLPIPPIEEQQRIVDRVIELMAKIDDYEKSENQLLMLKKNFPSDMRDSILQAAMQGELTQRSDKDSSADAVIQVMSEYHKKTVKPVAFDDDAYSFPESWSCVKLVDATVFYTGNSISENIKATRYTGLKEGYDYIGTKDVEFNHTITYDNGVKIPFDEPGFKYAEKDASLLCIEGGSAGKKIAITDRRVCFGNKLCAFHPIGIDKFFLYYYLQSPVFLHYFRDNISGLIGGVSMSKIKQLSIPIPPLEEQQRIVARLNELLPLCDGLTE